VHPGQAYQLQLQLCVDADQGLPLMPSPLNPAMTGPLSDPGQADSRSTPPAGVKSSNTPSSSSSSKTGKSKPKVPGRPGQSKQGSTTGHAAGSTTRDSTLEWKLRLLQQGVDWSNLQHRQLLQQLLLKQLMGRCLLRGGCCPFDWVDICSQ
jgi:hypothetical protein